MEFNAWNRMIELLGGAHLDRSAPQAAPDRSLRVCGREYEAVLPGQAVFGRLVSELWGDVRQNELVDEGLPNDLGVYPKACGQYNA